MGNRGSNPGRRATMAALIGVALLACLLVWVAQAIVGYNQLRNCLDSGRRTCVPSPDADTP